MGNRGGRFPTFLRRIAERHEITPNRSISPNPHARGLRAYPKIKANVIRIETESGVKKAMRSWTISDELWEKVEGYIPKHRRDPQKRYQHAHGQGRRPVPR